MMPTRTFRWTSLGVAQAAVIVTLVAACGEADDVAVGPHHDGGVATDVGASDGSTADADPAEAGMQEAGDTDSGVADSGGEPYDAGEFQIGIYWPPPAEHTTDQQYDYLQESSVNYVINVDSTNIDSHDQNLAILEKCAPRGIRFVVCDSSYAPVSALTDAQIDAYVDAYAGHTALGGFYVKDEPQPSEFAVYAARYNRFSERAPGSKNYLNLVGSTDIPGFINAFVDTVGAQSLQYLTHDYYPWQVQAGIVGNFFDVLSAYRRASLQRNVKMANFLQSVSWGGSSRRPGEHELRYDVFANLAYGAKALYWFTWWQPTGQPETFTPAIMNADGTQTDLYPTVRAVNRQIKTLGPTLMRLTSQVVYHSGVLASGCEPASAGFFWQPVDASQNAIVSFFADAGSRFYVMVVNRTLTDTSTLGFAIHPKPAAVAEVSKDTGLEVAAGYSEATGVVSAQFAPGEGRLFALPVDYAGGFARYEAHVQDFGWVSPAYNGGTAGTVGLAKSLEAVRISLVHAPVGTHARYRVYVSTAGWQEWVTDGATAGTTGQALPIERVEISLEGAPSGMHVRYRAHVRDTGWMSWVEDGATAGVQSSPLPIEALEVMTYFD